ncbi:MAG: hypothetical protein K1X36_09460 [Pyrinomonadaceae bacterium]|nr:hypothetical protein [Pyrinomonadaceae bacterium]
MDSNYSDQYDLIRNGGFGFFEVDRGLIAVWGQEARQFLDGLISNDVKTLEDGGEMLAAFPNAQGRLLAVVRIKRSGGRYLIETENTTREKIFQNLFRFTFAGDFFVEDLSHKYRYFEFFGSPEIPSVEGCIEYGSGRSHGCFVDADEVREYLDSLTTAGAIEIKPELYEILRVERGVFKYGHDIDDNTIVPELGIDGLISYTKGCYIGQEIIARIHFRGHVAKRITGLLIDTTEENLSLLTTGNELTTPDGRNAGRITSVTFSPKLGKIIAIAFVRYEHLESGTELIAGGYPATVIALPFI